jgi:hypothetical protein
MFERDPRVDPRPGDEVGGPAVKALVLSVSMVASGIDLVMFTACGAGYNYRPEHSSCRSLEDWQKFAKNAEVIHAAD